MLYTCSIASGSNGNCYYVGDGNDAVLIDAGISCRETEKRMRLRGLSLQSLRAIFISHEHIDHIKGVEVLSQKYQIPVYFTELTHKSSRLRIDQRLVRYFSATEHISVGNLRLQAFAKNHDAIDPHSFVIHAAGLRVGVFTDIGAVCPQVEQHFLACDAAYLEANYDELMLEQGRYPWHLKRRIAGDKGHLSNNQALELFLKSKAEKLQYLFLSHLSKDNNCPQLVTELFQRHSDGTQIVVAPRHEATQVCRLSPSAQTVLQQTLKQASLF